MAESENVYVKIGERGRLIERVAANPRDHVNLKGTGWVLKGSKGAPTKKDETAEPVGDIPLSAASVKALTDQVEAESGTGTSRETAAAARSAAKSKAAAGVTDA